MKELRTLAQLKVGTRLKIIAKSERNCYGSVSVKKIIDCGEWTEILINRSRNYYFHFENYLKGKSNWVVKIYVLKGLDRRLKNRGEI